MVWTKRRPRPISEVSPCYFLQHAICSVLSDCVWAEAPKAKAASRKSSAASDIGPKARSDLTPLTAAEVPRRASENNLVDSLCAFDTSELPAAGAAVRGSAKAATKASARKVSQPLLRWDGTCLTDNACVTLCV
jgi:hypothetical protein